MERPYGRSLNCMASQILLSWNALLPLMLTAERLSGSLLNCVLAVRCFFSVQSQESAGMLHHLLGGGWDPHHVNVVASISESSLGLKDNEEGTNEFIAVTKDGHGSSKNIFLCCFTRKQIHLSILMFVITAADDSGIDIWDLRMLKAPAAELPGHSHWTWAVRSNPEGGKMGGLGDGSRVKIGSGYNMSFLVWSTGQNCPAQSAGTDSAVNLWLASPPSNAELTPDSLSKTASKWTESLLHSYSDYEDSVYGLSWSSREPWLFASLSYDGRVVVESIKPHLPR
ncbi:WD repeat-containing protein DWA2, partial [Tanacetum coccineum]